MKEKAAKSGRSRKRLLWITFGVAATAVGAVVGVSSYAASSMTTVTRVPIKQNPADYNLKYSDISFPSRDGLILRGWWLEASNDRPCIVTVHGEKGHRAESGSVKILEIARELVNSRYNVLMFDLRGHGHSEGKRASAGYHEKKDLLGAIDYAKQRGVTKIGIIGFSMGAATALMTAARCQEIGAVIADSSFADLADIVEAEFLKRSSLPKFFLPWILFMSRNMYGIDLSLLKPVDDVKKSISAPIMIIHGERDDIIPVEHAYLLARCSRGPQNKLWIVPEAQHVGAYAARPKEYINRVTSFFDRVLGKK